MELNRAIERVEQAAPLAGKVQTDFDVSTQAETQAEGEVLVRVIDTSLPFLRSIAGKIAERWNPAAVVYLPYRAVILATIGRFPQHGEPLERVPYTGEKGPFKAVEALVLKEDGTLQELVRTSYEGAASVGWYTQHVGIPTPYEAVRDWDLRACVVSLATAFEAVVRGNAPKRAAEARKRAAKLMALSILL